MMTGQEVVRKAKRYLGDKGSKFWKKYGFSYAVAWCCIFVWYVFQETKKSLFYSGGKVCNCRTAWNWCRANMTRVKMKDAKPGDIVFFTWSGKGGNRGDGSVSIDHIGLIEREGTSSIAHTIEGNTGSNYPGSSKVMERDRNVKYIVGIYRPKYDQGADPDKKEDKKETEKASWKVLSENGMNIRKGPSTSEKRVGGIGKGKTFKSTKRQGDWLYGSSGKIKGWICEKKGSKTYLKKI